MILICEPQCKGLEHVDFNAAIIATIHFAFKNEQIIFYAEKDHQNFVSNKLKGLLNGKVSYYEIDVIGKIAKQYKKALHEFKICRCIFQYAHKNGINKILFCSTTSESLIAIKILLFFYSNLKCVTIPHSILLTITKWPKRWLIGIPFWFKSALLLMNSNRIRYLIIGGFTEEWLKGQLPALKNKLLSIEMPYLFKRKNIMTSNNDRKTIRFGFFGFGSYDKGIELFIKISEDIQRAQTKIIPEFILIGNTYKTEQGMNFGYVYMPSPYKPLSTDDYEKYANSIDYSIILYNPKVYNIVHGASVLDSLEYCKPIISTRSLLVDLYFKEMGDIGYLCDHYDALIKTLLTILNEFPTERYQKQCENILSGRESLLPDKLSSTFKEKINKFWI